MAHQKRHRDEELDSEFEYAPEKKRRTWLDDPLSIQKPVAHQAQHSVAIPSKQLVGVERDKEEWRARRFHLLSMDAYSRHKALVNQYLLTQGKGIEHFKRPTENDRNDYTVLAEEHRFLWSEDDEVGSWEKRLAKTYYDRLFKEYAISDLSRYKENKVALRWRIQKEVIDGKGQFVCGNKHCSARDELQSWEVNFAYVEQEEKKNALVKLRLCEDCSRKLNYHHRRKLWKNSGSDSKAGSAKTRKKQKHKHKRKHRHSGSSKDKRKHKRSGRDASPRTSESEESSSREGDSEEDEAATSHSNASAIWSKPAEVFLEKSKDEEYDDYFKDMLL